MHTNILRLENFMPFSCFVWWNSYTESAMHVKFTLCELCCYRFGRPDLDHRIANSAAAWNRGCLQSHSALSLVPSSAASNLALRRSSSIAKPHAHLKGHEARLQTRTAHVLPARDAGRKLHRFQFALRACMTVTSAAGLCSNASQGAREKVPARRLQLCSTGQAHRTSMSHKCI